MVRWEKSQVLVYLLKFGDKCESFLDFIGTAILDLMMVKGCYYIFSYLITTKQVSLSISIRWEAKYPWWDQHMIILITLADSRD